TEALIEATATMPPAVGAALSSGAVVLGPAAGAPIQFVDVQPRTSDAKVHLEGAYVFHPDPATEQFPLTLISPASAHTISSTLGEFRPGHARLKMHPDDARARFVEEDDPVRIFNELGEVWCRVN